MSSGVALHGINFIYYGIFADLLSKIAIGYSVPPGWISSGNPGIGAGLQYLESVRSNGGPADQHT
jgi:hypothetical protein